MGWTPECQRLRWFQHTTDEWLAWIEGLPDGGFGRYTKDQWMEWWANMNLEHGPSEGARDGRMARMMAINGWNGGTVRGEMIRALAKCFTDNGGDAAAIARACGCSAESLTVSPPASADDFANKFLDGTYLPSGPGRFAELLASLSSTLPP